MGRTVRFSGETTWDAIVHHWGLNWLELEDAFHVYCIRRGYDNPELLPLETLEVMYDEWQENVGKHFGAVSRDIV